jgi:biopolymer transport protein ExbB
MKIRLVTALLLACLAPVSAQSPAETAKADLKMSVARLQEVQSDYSEQRRTLYRDINRLDDEALNLAKELRALEREEEQRVAKVKSLEREIEARTTDFNYASGILNQYSKALVTRLHPAENQRYLETINRLDQQAASAADDPEAELEKRVGVLSLGVRRIGEIAAADRFPGKALKNGNDAVNGDFMIMGPSVFFAAGEGGFEGVATFADTGTEFPTVVGIAGSSGIIANAISNGEGLLPFDGTMGKAIEVAAAKESLMETIRKGGVVGYAILALGAISFLIAIFKVYEITRFKVPTRAKINEILDRLLSGDDEAARNLAAGIPGQAGDLVRTGVARFHEKRRVLEESLFEKLVIIKPRLERFLPFLALTAAAAPLMGLLGTVLGIIKTFKAMALYGTGNAKSFSAGISEALITTAEGLVVAIPVLVIHGMLKSLCKSRFTEVESVGIALINGTTERDRDSKASDPSDDAAAEEDLELSPNPA